MVSARAFEESPAGVEAIAGEWYVAFAPFAVVVFKSVHDDLGILKGTRGIYECAGASSK